LQTIKSGYKAFSESVSVVVGTIHGTKGMEFRACHVLGLNFIKNFSSQKNMAFTVSTRPKTSLRLYHDKSLPGYLENGILSIDVNQRRKMTPCQRPILTPLKSKKISFSVL